MPTPTHDRLPDNPSLEQLRRQARELQRGIRAGDPEAQRLAALAPDPDRPPEGYPLHLAQLAVARRYGYASWQRLVERVRTGRRLSRTITDRDGAGPVDRFLQNAVLTYADDDQVRRSAAARIASATPDLASQRVHAAAALADPDALAAHLQVDPGAARREGGPFDWEPVLYFAYSRVAPRSREGAVRSLRLLLDSGADPNAGFLWNGLPTPFTVVTGLLGGGELGTDRQPAHPYWLPLARMVLEAGADPNDGQALYNRIFTPDDAHLRLLFEFGLGRGDGGPWHRRLPETDSPDALLQAQLAWAVTHGLTDRIRLLAANGVRLDVPLDGTSLPVATRATPLALARLSGRTDSARVLRELGAPEDSEPESAMVGALLAGDAAAVAQLEQENPGLVARIRLDRPSLVLRAAANGHADALDLLVDNGFDVNALGRSDVVREEPWHTALHHAAGENDVDMIRRLLALDADRTVRDARFDATPADWARHLGHVDAARLLDGPH